MSSEPGAIHHAPPITLDELPPLAGVILSHDHYDHLDYQPILRLVPRTEHFLAPLGVGDRLIAWGVPAEKVVQLDWWEGTTLADGLQFIATPARHFSGRGLTDRNRSLWASWVMIDGTTRIFFSGDGGYSESFKRIGEQYGPFDLTMMECGAYDRRWPEVHMQPEQVIQAHRDLRGRRLLPIHNGTFDLAMHPWKEPLERITALAEDQAVPLATPRMGECFDLHAPQSGEAWWRQIS
ncbi:MAG: hypothetical protein CGU28_02505 [Candidatus Dactylopiibacterium carminicum]|uniref:Metallo-beta-lactamase domain-containing protein n=1 Tax=Candidatus Dactylopiibacterium carminicum TaxID=857335 RepID=A0A272EXQ4_9RHOO|nr:MBL fold metallo-hydrolase [Candidatus Dactylopiibacterium carminicum]KAF7600550.1 hypothetical protein BGI27_02325 [Candidatus Dactylopiibacterium carminicum]PAS94881.1 MAG: hypothetical protein CGU29_01840 [Candidatus Dactylopiibacterium carminicum]PAS98017.1 MAG: hypothetical protein CGU28_02505 [Candidatus Dactylopiibacterium carminicum]